MMVLELPSIAKLLGGGVVGRIGMPPPKVNPVAAKAAARPQQHRATA